MKKLSLFMMSLIFSLALVFSSCTGCGNNKDVQAQKDSTEVVLKDSATTIVALNVEHIIAMDRQEMYLNHGDNYRWFETCIKLKDFLNEENDGSIEELVNVFQVVNERGNGFDVKVYKIQHFADGTVAKDSTYGFWVEDQPLNDEAIKVTYEQAYDNLMRANIVKPHSCYVTLRKQVGPVDVNPQYIFGNIREVVFVDATTGEVSGINPAFPKEKGFKMPLGEWP